MNKIVLAYEIEFTDSVDKWTLNQYRNAIEQTCAKLIALGYTNHITFASEGIVPKEDSNGKALDE